MMANIKSFSQTQDILKSEQWESLRIIDETSPTTKLVADKMRDIVVRLMSRAAGQYNINDFVFLVSDVQEENAFFVNGAKTLNGKHIVGVMAPMIDYCKTEDELAAIIAHEMGHFVYSQIFPNGANTVFQERGADLHAVDLLIDGGYDPNAYVAVSKRMAYQQRPHDNIVTSVLSALDVHGGTFSRVEDIEAYMTYLKKERGDLGHGTRFDTAKWRLFQDEFSTAFKNDRYVSYVDENWGAGPIDNQNFASFLDFMIDGVASGEIGPGPRLTECFGRLKENNVQYGHTDVAAPSLDVIELYVVNEPVPHDIAQKIIQLVEHVLSKIQFGNANAWVGVINQLRVMYDKKLPLVGRMATIRDDLQMFINATDQDTITKVVERRYDEIQMFRHFLQYFEPLPSFRMPPANEIIGKPLPWAHHMKIARDSKTHELASFIHDVFLDVESKYEWGKKAMVPIQWPDNTPYKYIADEETGIVLSAGDMLNNTEIETAHDEFIRYLDTLDKLANFARGKISADEFWADMSHDDAVTFFKVLDDGYVYPDVLINSKYMKADEKRIRASRTYHQFVKNLDDPKGNFLSWVINKDQNDNFRARVTAAVIDVVDNTTINPPVSRTYVLHKMYAGIYNRHDKIDMVLKNNIWQRVPKYATREELVKRDYIDRFGLSQLVWPQIARGEPTPELDMILKMIGYPTPKNQAEFASILCDMHNEHNTSWLSDTWIAKCLADDLPIVDDLQTFIEKDSLYSFMSDAPAVLQDEMAKYIRRHNLFPTNDFARGVRICAAMDERDYFSKELSNKSEYLWILIDNMKTMPITQREDSLFVLLTGAYDGWVPPVSNIDTFPPQVDVMVQMYVDAIHERIGPDDGTPEYTAKIQEIKQKFDDALFFNNHMLRQKIFRALSDKIVSQDAVSTILAPNVSVSGYGIESNAKFGNGIEVFLSILEKHPALSIATIEFLNARLTQQSMDEYKNKMIDLVDKHTKEIRSYIPAGFTEKYLNREFMEFFYNTFWGNGLELRAFVMNKLLNRISDKQHEDNRMRDQIQYVCNMHFPDDSKYHDAAQMIFETAIMSFEPFERGLILAAIASADKNTDDEHKNAAKSVGVGLRMFFENMGPAWVKFGQLLSYVPELPSEIRHDLGKLKDRADIPSRWDLFETIKNTLPNDIQKNIIRVDEVLGAGSFWVTAKIKYRDPATGVEQDKVLSLLRPYALEKLRSGFDVIERAVGKLAEQDGRYKSLHQVATQARKSAEYEVDVIYGNKQFERAKKLYGDYTVTVDGTEYTPNVSEWEYYGVGYNSIGYKLMELAPGASLDKVNASADVRRKMALAYVTIELTNLFKGDVWDIDRHTGQQNFDILPDGNVEINIYDTGAQMNRAPGPGDKIMLAIVLYDFMHAVRTGIPLDQQILDTIKQLDTWAEKYKVDTGYVADVQKGLMALSDIIEYQKEIKDIDGNVIQERLSLSSDDLTHAVEAVFDSPTTDGWLKMTLAGRLLKDNLPRRIKSLVGGKKTKNPVRVIKITRNTDTHSVHFDKPDNEIVALENESAENQSFGIKKKHIKSQPQIKQEISEDAFMLPLPAKQSKDIA